MPRGCPRALRVQAVVDQEDAHQTKLRRWRLPHLFDRRLTGNPTPPTSSAVLPGLHRLPEGDDPRSRGL